MVSFEDIYAPDKEEEGVDPTSVSTDYPPPHPFAVEDNSLVPRHASRRRHLVHSHDCRALGQGYVKVSQKEVER